MARRRSAGDDGVFVMYEYVLTSGERHRNVEYQIVRDGRIAEAHVFFGGRYDYPTGKRRDRGAADLR